MSVWKRTLYFFILFWILAVVKEVQSADTDIVINEIGAYESYNYEWIEIYNKGGSAVDTTGWKFYEDSTNHRWILYQGDDLIIEPGEYAIVADVAENFHIKYSGFSGTIIDSAWSTLNESGEAIALKNSSGEFVESFTYISCPNHSLERVNPNLADYTSANWSEHASGNTAGAENSNYNSSSDTTPPATISDLAASTSSGSGEVDLNWTAPGDDGNSGRASSYIVRYDTAIIDTQDKFGNATNYSNSWIPLSAGNTESHTIGGLTAGQTYYFAIEAMDEVPNQASLSNSPWAEAGTGISMLSGDVVINELMWCGSTVSYADEWIELRNMTSSSIKLSNWNITKLVSGEEKLMLTIPSDKSISAGRYFLIANYSEDSEKSKLAVSPSLVNTSVSLSNSTLQIKLYNGTWNSGGTLIDTANDGGSPLTGDNLNKYSMERNSSPGDGTLSSSWHTATSSRSFDLGATERGTPGSANSLPSNDPPEIVNVERSPLYPGNEDKVKVSCEAKDSDLNSVTLKWSTGGDYSGVSMSSESEKYKGEISPQVEGTKVNYYVEARDQGGQTSRSPTDSTYFYQVGVNPRVVINEFLPDPASDWNGDGKVDSKDEWIELYNKESSAVDISNWILDDIENGGTKPYAIGTTIEPGGFLTFCKSETGVGLNNGGDTVRVLDSAGNLVDSYSYTSSSDDISCGRVPDGGNNWAFLESPTPGKGNPSTLSTISSGEVIISEIMYDPLSNDYDCEWIELYNKEDKAINLKGWTLEGKEIPNSLIGARSYLVITDDLLDEDKDGYSFERDWGNGSGSWGDYSGEDFAVTEMTISFTNKEDTIVLSDGSKGIDTLAYKNSWGGGKGISLERINFNLANTQANWGPSQDKRGGTPGELNSLSGTEDASSQAALLINEINFKTSPHWVEIYCKDDANRGKGVNLAGYYLTDLDNPDKTFGSCTIKTGEYLLLRYGSESEDEVSSSAGNENGIIDLWTSVSYITSTDEQMVLYNPTQKIVDAVCWSDEELTDSERRDLEEVCEAGEWEGSTADFCINSKEISRKKTLARLNFVDTNSKDDWAASLPTPGWDNSDLEKANRPVEFISFNILPRVFFPRGDKNPQTTTISFTLSKEAEVTLRIYDVKGRLVKTLLDQEPLLPGINEVIWEGKDKEGRIVPIGIYIVYIEAVCSRGNDTEKSTVVAAKKLD